ncbi:hypothetical protein T06_6096 [Trichinella sp. T6]|nr:hypothetical protein T06_6096 [Trichinella sp. T6]
MYGFIKDKGLKIGVNTSESVQTAPGPYAVCLDKDNAKGSPFFACAVIHSACLSILTWQGSFDDQEDRTSRVRLIHCTPKQLTSGAVPNWDVLTA